MKMKKTDYTLTEVGIARQEGRTEIILRLIDINKYHSDKANPYANINSEHGELKAMERLKTIQRLKQEFNIVTTEENETNNNKRKIQPNAT